MQLRAFARHPIASALEPNTRMQVRGRLLRPWWRFRFASFGDRSVLIGPRWVAGARHIAIGEGVRIFGGAWLAAEPSTWASPEPSLVIGDNCLVRDDAVLSASEKVVLEQDVVLAGRVTVIDSDHTWTDGHPRITDNKSVTGPVRIGRGSWIAEQSIVLRNTDIGVYSIVAANSVVRGSFPDYSLIAGSPAVVVGSTAARVPASLRAKVNPTESTSP